MASTADFKNGLVLQIDGQLWQIIEFQHVKPGKGPAFVRTKLKNVLSGKVVDKTYNAGVKVETATVDRRDATYLYRDGSDFVFMDSQDYEQHPLSESLVGDAAKFLLESMPVQIAFHDGAPLYLELPVTVELEVTHHRARPAGRPVQRRHQARDRRDRCRDPGAVVHQHRRQAQGRFPRRQLSGKGECLTVEGDRGRHQARKRAVDLLFEAEARGLTPAEVAEARNALAETQSDVSPLNPYTVTVARGVTDHAAHIDDLISAHLQGWTLDRLPAVDRAILRVAVWELLHADDVPEPVAVDEAVELAKQLSTDDSPGFVNGVLGQVMLVTPQIRAAAQAVRGAGDGSAGT